MGGTEPKASHSPKCNFLPEAANRPRFQASTYNIITGTGFWKGEEEGEGALFFSRAHVIISQDL